MSEFITFYDDDHPVMDRRHVQIKIKVKEEIVRRRDCVGFEETWNGWECQRFSGEYHSAHPDGFCYWGERRSK